GARARGRCGQDAGRAGLACYERASFSQHLRLPWFGNRPAWARPCTGRMALAAQGAPAAFCGGGLRAGRAGAKRRVRGLQLDSEALSCKNAGTSIARYGLPRLIIRWNADSHFSDSSSICTGSTSEVRILCKGEATLELVGT